MNIPAPVIATVAGIISKHYSHAELGRLFLYADAPGEPPSGNKLVKTQEWLKRCNKESGIDPLSVLGKLIEDYMERALDDPTQAEWEKSLFDPHEEWKRNREIIKKVLGNNGLSYFTGGVVRQAGVNGPSRTLEDILKSRSLSAVDDEFDRAMKNIVADPRASLTAACAIIESLCKFYIEENKLQMPKEKTVKPLWNTVRVHFGMTPETIADEDLLKIIQGISSIVDGLGAFRTHEGSAHGGGPVRYNIKPRHARLAVHAAHTLATFILETWDEQSKNAAKPK